MNFLWLIFAFLLILLNAFFVAAEFGMVKLRDTRIQNIKEKYGFRGFILEQVHHHLDAYLSACQLGITLTSLGLGWIGEPAFAFLLEPLFNFLGITSAEATTIIAFFMAFSLLSFLHIVVGELMPKSLAIRQSEAVSLWTAVPLYYFYWLMFPAIWMLNKCSNFLLKITRLDVTHKKEFFYSTEEIQSVLHASHLHGELTKDETEILQHTLEFADLKITEIMRSKEEMVVLDLQEPVENLLNIMSDYHYSRYPVYDRVKKEMIGIIHVKDVFTALHGKKDINTVTPYIRPILKISHRLPALNLLRKFREGKTHFALIYLEKNHLLGFVTLDNLLHVVLGRIQDEFHKTTDDWIKNPDGSLTIQGKCSIYSLERALDSDFTLTSHEEELNTMSGLITSRLGYFPSKGEKISFKEFDAIIEEIKGAQIRKIIIIPIKERESDDETS